MCVAAIIYCDQLLEKGPLDFSISKLVSIPAHGTGLLTVI